MSATKEQRIEAALATVGETTDGLWEREVYNHGGSRIFVGYNLIADTYGPKSNADLFFAAPDLRDEVIALRGRVGDLSMLVRQLVHHIGPENTLSKQAMDYLSRKELQGSPLRNIEEKP